MLIIWIIITILSALAIKALCGWKLGLASLGFIPIFLVLMTWIENTFGYQVVLLLAFPFVIWAGTEILEEEI